MLICNKPQQTTLGNVREFFGNDVRLRAYWPLKSNAIDFIGGNTLVLTDVTFNKGAAYFNGVTSGAVSTNNINLTTTNKVTVLCNVKLHAMSPVAAIIYEMGTIPSADGAFNLLTRGDIAGQPIAVLDCGDVGQSQAGYNQTTINYNNGEFHCYAATFDFSLATSEAKLIYEGLPRTIDNQISNNNNTGAFNNYKLYVGIRNGLGSRANMSIRDLAIFSGILDTNEIFEYIRWGKGVSGKKISALVTRSLRRC